MQRLVITGLAGAVAVHGAQRAWRASKPRAQAVSKELKTRVQVARHALRGRPVLYGAGRQVGTVLLNSQSGNGWLLSSCHIDGRTIREQFLDEIRESWVGGYGIKLES